MNILLGLIGVVALVGIVGFGILTLYRLWTSDDPERVPLEPWDDPDE